MCLFVGNVIDSAIVLIELAIVIFIKNKKKMFVHKQKKIVNKLCNHNQLNDIFYINMWHKINFRETFENR